MERRESEVLKAELVVLAAQFEAGEITFEEMCMQEEGAREIDAERMMEMESDAECSAAMLPRYKDAMWRGGPIRG